jgi:hypothetical protein
MLLPDFLYRLFCYQPDIFIFVFQQLFKRKQGFLFADYPQEISRIPAHDRFGMGEKGQKAVDCFKDIYCIQFFEFFH